MLYHTADSILDALDRNHESVIVGRLSGESIYAEAAKIIRDQQLEIKRLMLECQRLRIACGPSEMIESDYIPDDEWGSNGSLETKNAVDDLAPPKPPRPQIEFVWDGFFKTTIRKAAGGE